MRWLVGFAVLLVSGCVVVKAPSTASRTSAIKGITTIQTAEVMYHDSYGRFATSLQELGPPANGADTASAAGLIERDLASGEKDGYRFTLTATPAGYAISATPIEQGVSSRSYFSDPVMHIHMHAGPGIATEDDPDISAPS